MKRVRRDWTLASAIVYELTPLVQSLAFDDAQRNNQTVYLMGALDQAHFAGGLSPWLGEPSTWRQDLPWFSNLWAMVAGVTLAPALLGLLPGPANPEDRKTAGAGS